MEDKDILVNYSLVVQTEPVLSKKRPFDDETASPLCKKKCTQDDVDSQENEIESKLKQVEFKSPPHDEETPLKHQVTATNITAAPSKLALFAQENCFHQSSLAPSSVRFDFNESLKTCEVPTLESDLNVVEFSILNAQQIKATAGVEIEGTIVSNEDANVFESKGEISSDTSLPSTNIQILGTLMDQSDDCNSEGGEVGALGLRKDGSSSKDPHGQVSDVSFLRKVAPTISEPFLSDEDEDPLQFADITQVEDVSESDIVDNEFHDASQSSTIVDSEDACEDDSHQQEGSSLNNDDIPRDYCAQSEVVVAQSEVVVKELHAQSETSLALSFSPEEPSPMKQPIAQSVQTIATELTDTSFDNSDQRVGMKESMGLKHVDVPMHDGGTTGNIDVVESIGGGATELNEIAFPKLPSDDASLMSSISTVDIQNSEVEKLSEVNPICVVNFDSENFPSENQLTVEGESLNCNNSFPDIPHERLAEAELPCQFEHFSEKTRSDEVETNELSLNELTVENSLSTSPFPSFTFKSMLHLMENNKPQTLDLTPASASSIKPPIDLDEQVPESLSGSANETLTVDNSWIQFRPVAESFTIVSTLASAVEEKEEATTSESTTLTLTPTTTPTITPATNTSEHHLENSQHAISQQEHAPSNREGTTLGVHRLDESRTQHAEAPPLNDTCLTKEFDFYDNNIMVDDEVDKCPTINKMDDTQDIVQIPQLNHPVLHGYIQGNDVPLQLNQIRSPTFSLLVSRKFKTPPILPSSSPSRGLSSLLSATQESGRRTEVALDHTSLSGMLSHEKEVELEQRDASESGVFVPRLVSVIPQSRETSRPPSPQTHSLCSRESDAMDIGHSHDEQKESTVPLSFHLLEMDRQLAMLRKKHEMEMSRERIKVADAIMDRANITIEAERVGMHRELLTMKDGIIAEATQEYQTKLTEASVSAQVKTQEKLTNKVDMLRSDWRNRKLDTTKLVQEYSQDIDAKALLLALQKEWSGECESLLKEREENCNKKFKDELKQYRDEIKMDLEAELKDKVDRAVTLARIEWDRTNLSKETPTTTCK